MHRTCKPFPIAILLLMALAGASVAPGGAAVVVLCERAGAAGSAPQGPVCDPTSVGVAVPAHECGLADAADVDGACAHGLDTRPLGHGAVQCDSFVDAPGAMFHTVDFCHHSAISPVAEDCHPPATIDRGNLDPVAIILTTNPDARHSVSCNHAADGRGPEHDARYCPAYAEEPGANRHAGGDPCVHVLAVACIPPVMVTTCDHGSDPRKTPHNFDVVCQGLQFYQDFPPLPGNMHDGIDWCKHYAPQGDCTPTFQAECKHYADGALPHDDILCHSYVHFTGPNEHVQGNPCIHAAPHPCADPLDAACTHTASSHGSLVCAAYLNPPGTNVHLDPNNLCIHGPDITVGVSNIQCSFSATESHSQTCDYKCSDEVGIFKIDVPYNWQVKVLVVGQPGASAWGRVRCDTQAATDPLAQCTATVQPALLVSQCTSGVTETTLHGHIVCEATVSSAPAPDRYVVLCIEPPGPEGPDG